MIRPDGELRTVDGRGRAVARRGRPRRADARHHAGRHRAACRRAAARAPGAARPADRPAEPRAVPRPPAARAHARATAAARASPSTSATSTTSRTSTTASATTPATSCSSRCRRGCARRLRAGDTVARFGGDEFVILCEDLDSEGEAIRIAERIAEAFGLPFELDGRPHHLSVSVGVVFVEGRRGERDRGAARRRRGDVPREGRRQGPLRALRRADARVAASTRLQTEADLRRALDDGELRAALPAGASTWRGGAFVGAEALVRWQHPERGLLAAGASSSPSRRTAA